MITRMQLHQQDKTAETIQCTELMRAQECVADGIMIVPQ